MESAARLNQSRSTQPDAASVDLQQGCVADLYQHRMGRRQPSFSTTSTEIHPFLSFPEEVQSTLDSLFITLRAMAALSQTPPSSKGCAASPTPGLSPSASSSINKLSIASHGAFNLAADPVTRDDECDSASTSRSSSPRIPRTIVANGVTYEILRPEELDHDVPVFGERRRKSGAVKPKKNFKRNREEEDEAKWETKRRRLIQEKVLKKEFVGYTEEDMTVTEDGLRLPAMPTWLNITRERQDDGRWGVFVARPSKEDIKERWPEIIRAMEPIGVEIGAVKVILPNGYLDDPLPIEELNQYIRHSTSPIPADYHLPSGSIPSTPTPLFTLPNGSNITNLRSPRLNERADLIPPPQFDKNGIPKIWVFDQCLPLHSKSISNLAPIYCVLSTNKRQISSSQLLTDITDYKARQCRITAGDPAKEAFAPLTESTMLLRGRTWAHISNGDKGGVSIYSSDNDANSYTRAYIGVGNPRLTELPGNYMFDSKFKIVGIHTPFFYFGRAHTLFALHAEDYNAMSLNYHHFGADKIWRVVSPHHYHVVEDFIASHLCTSKKGRRQNEKKCSQFVRHASIYLPGPTLEVAGARSIQFRQRPGELVITWPLAYHEGYNEGLNINEACGYGHKNWRRVFATGEEEKGEEAIYRPCGERCMGGANPIILDFEPEVWESNGEADTDGVDVTTIEEDEMIEGIVLMTEMSVNRGHSRKRSFSVGDGGSGVQVKCCLPPQKKVKVTMNGERDVVENKIGNHIAATEELIRKRLWPAEVVGQNGIQIAWDQSPPMAIKVAIGNGGCMAENEVDNCKVESERIEDVKKLEDYGAESTRIARTKEAASTSEIGKYNIPSERLFNVQYDVNEIEMAGDEQIPDGQRIADETNKTEDESEAERVNLVPVQLDTEQ